MYPESLEQLIYHFSKLPGIGRKTAQRLSFHILKQPKDFVLAFAKSIQDVQEKTTFCKNCYNISEMNLCTICLDLRRDQETIMLVVDYSDIFAIEKTNEYHGSYHVLGNILSPLDGIGPEQLNIKGLLNRLNKQNIKELILALTPNADGEATITYLMRLLGKQNLNISRIARGVPIGTQLEYIDQVTLGRAISGRNNI